MKLAIIIPVYNAEETIKRAILSVDTSVPYEIICINDGSTDQTQHVLTELQQKHPHIKVTHQSNQGAARSRNVGLEAMSEDVDAFLFLDAGDEFLPSRIDWWMLLRKTKKPILLSVKWPEKLTANGKSFRPINLW